MNSKLIKLSIIPIWCARLAGLLSLLNALHKLMYGAEALAVAIQVTLALAHFTLASVAGRMRMVTKERACSKWAIVWCFVSICMAAAAIYFIATCTSADESSLASRVLQGSLMLIMAFGSPLCLAMIASASKALKSE